MRQNVFKTRPDKGALRQKQANERFGVIREVVFVRGFFAEDPSLGDLIVIFVKRQLACEQGVKNDAQTPHVHFFSSVFLPLQHFRSTVADGPAECLQVAGFAFVLSGESKVAQLDVLILVE